MAQKAARKRRRITQKAKPVSAVSVAPSPWDTGAAGQANRHRLVEEDATEIDKTNSGDRQ